MGAFAGVLHPGSPPDPGPVVTMLRRMDARGPDARVVEDFGAGVLGACVGDAGGPAWDARRRWLVVLTQPPTNARALRTELSARDRVDPSASASALAAAVFAEIGFERGLGRLEGDAAVAAWDREEGALYVARDRAGLNPVHFAVLPGGGVAFASDLAGLVAHPALGLVVDPGRVATLALLGLLPPPDTLSRAIEHLDAGTLVKLGSGAPALRRWWEVGANPSGAAGAAVQWARSTRMAVALATRQRCEGDAAVACGGGLFSRAVAALADPGGAPLPILRFGPGGTVDLAAADLGSVLDEMAGGLGEPVVTPDAIGWWVVARAAWERGNDTVLTGLGGAATFVVPDGGRRQRVARVLGMAGSLRPGWARPLVAPGVTDAVWDGIDRVEAACPTADAAAAGPWLTRRLLLAARILGPAERAFAAFGVRLAAPLADPRLLTLAASIPLEHHRAGGVPRALFARAMVDLVPQPPLPAGPFLLPLAEWLRGPCRALVEDLPDRVEGMVDATYARALVDGHIEGRFDASGRLWALLLLDRWTRNHASPGPSSSSWADSRPPIL